MRTYPLYGRAEKDFITIDFSEVAAVADLGDYPAAQGACLIMFRCGKRCRLSVSRQTVESEWKRWMNAARQGR